MAIREDLSICLFCFPGTFKPSFCPSVHGCRGLLQFDETGDTGVLNLIDTDVKIVFNNTSGQQIWLVGFVSKQVSWVLWEKVSPLSIL